MRGLLGFVKDYVSAIRGSIAVRARRLRPRTRLALATVALLPALLLTTAYVVGLDGDGTESDARHRPHAVSWPDSSGSGADDSSPRASTEPGSDEGTDPADSDSDSDADADAGDDNPTLPGGQDGDKQITSGPGPEDPTSLPWPGGSIGTKSAPSSVEGPTPAAPAPSTTATTAPPTTSAPSTTGPPTTTTVPPSGDPPPDGREGGLLGDLTDSLLGTVTGLL